MNDESIASRHRFSCEMAIECVGLERLLQVVRRRGFVIETVAARARDDGFRVDLVVRGTRPAETLRAHLLNLASVRSVSRPLDRCFVADARFASAAEGCVADKPLASF